MKNYFLMLVLTVAVVFIGCRKKEECERNNSCTVKFTNANSNNPYNIYINGTYKFQINGNNGTNTAIVTPGSLSLRAEQASGYAFSPTIYTQNLTVAQCENSSWQF